MCIYLRANTGRSLAVQWLRLHLDCRVLIFRQGAKIPYASWPKHQKHKTEEYCNIFNKDFKNGPREKKKSEHVSPPGQSKIFPQVDGHLIKDGGKNSYTLNYKNVYTTTHKAYPLN